ncbi:MAG: efflux RND transporter periplasmic adaptor subunit [Planctomycetia bacterium]|nr:efflux RND transporter periplasmic adaptor subunit [Planctomycetia bacterium]
MRKLLDDRWRRWEWVLGLLLVGAAATVSGNGGGQTAEAKSKTKNASPVRIENCTIKPLEEVVLAFDRPGILGKLSVREGDTVTPDQFLATLKDDVARASLAVAQLQADSDVEIVYAELAAEVMKTEHEQMLEANRRQPGTVPELEVRRARLNHDKAIAEVEKARQGRDVFKAKRDEAAAQLDTYRLEAPFEGFITRVHLVKGASVKQGDPVIELASTRKVRVEGYVLVKDAAHIRTGCAVEVHLEKPDEVGADAVARVFPGKIAFVDLAKASVTKVRVWAEVDNPDQFLRAGLFATMTVLPAGKND